MHWQPRAAFSLLFKSAQHSILTLSKDEKYMGATRGIVSILHTNGQDPNFHPHIHNIVNGGGSLPIADKAETGQYWTGKFNTKLQHMDCNNSSELKRL